MPLTTYTSGEVLTAASLNANFTFAAANPVSKVGQVLSTALLTSFTTSSTSYTDITGLSVSITPTVNTSKVLVMVQLIASQEVGVNQALVQLVRGTTPIDIGDAAGSRSQATQQIRGFGAEYPSVNTFVYLDSPATTSATTYKMQAINLSSGTFFVNRSMTDTNTSFYARTASTITVMEILA